MDDTTTRARIAAIAGLRDDVDTGELRTALRRKRVEGLSSDEREALVATVDWPTLATGLDWSALSPAFELLFPRDVQRDAPMGTRGALTPFDTPLDTLHDLVRHLPVEGDRVEDAFRWLELADSDAFDRVVTSLPPKPSRAIAASGEVEILERSCRLLWRDREPTREANALERVREGLARYEGYASARVIAADLGLDGFRAFGHKTHRSDHGPLVALARELDDDLFAEALTGAMKLSAPAVDRIHRVGTVRWDAVADRVDGDRLLLDRSAAGVRLTGELSIAKAHTARGRFRVAPGKSEGGGPRVSEAGAKKLLTAWSNAHNHYCAVFAQLGATHPSQIKKRTILMGGPDVVGALAPAADDKLRRSSLAQLLKQQGPNSWATEAALHLVEALEKPNVGLLTAAAAGHHRHVVDALLDRHSFTRAQRTKARAAAEGANAFMCARALEDGTPN